MKNKGFREVTREKSIATNRQRNGRYTEECDKPKGEAALHPCLAMVSNLASTGLWFQTPPNKQTNKQRNIQTDSVKLCLV